MFSYFNIRNILTSLNVVFFTISSSSDSLNFLMATILSSLLSCIITYFWSLFIFRFVNDSIGSFSYNANNFVFVHIIDNIIIFNYLKLTTTLINVYFQSYFSNLQLKVSSNNSNLLLRFYMRLGSGGNLFIYLAKLR